MKFLKSILLAGALVLGFGSTAHASTFTAATCNYADVNAVINGPTHTAVNGDIINIPAGTCTWASNLVIPSNIGITLIGAGTPNSGSGTTGAATPTTIIIDNAGSSNAMISAAPLFGNATMRISMMAIDPFSTSTTLAEPINLASGTCTTSGCPNVRVDNITFGKNTQWVEANNGSQAAALIRVNNVFGVLDHNTAPAGSNVELFNAQMTSYLGVGLNGDNSWAQPNSLGGANNVFAENNLWNTTYLSMNDCEAGAIGGCRFVIRYNTLNTNLTGAFGLAENHGTETAGRGRSGREMEVYNNTVTCPLACASIDAGIRGGTAMLYGNHAVLTPGQGANTWAGLNTYRTVYTAIPWGACGGSGSWDQNDGTTYFTGTMAASGGLTMTDGTKSFTTNQLAPAGAPFSVRDVTQNFWAQIVSNTATTITVLSPISESGWTGFNNGDTYQILRASVCIDQPGRGTGTLLSGSTPSPTGWVSEALEPIYQWADFSTGGANVNNPMNSGSGQVIANRDYYPQVSGIQTTSTSPFNGTSGTGWGTLANRPTTCTTGVGYAEYVSGNLVRLDKCTATNAWTAAYTSYIYPHPLTLSGPHTYYVSTAGSDSNAGTLVSPWLTPAHASSVAVAGDTVLFLDGTYTLPAGGSGNGDWFITSSGTLGNPITFRSATKWGAKLVGTDSSGSTSVIGLSGSYLTIQDFDITGVDSNGINMTTNVTSATGNVAQGNYIHDMTTPCTSNSGAGITSGGGASYTSVDHMSMIGNFVINILDTGGSCHASAGLAMMIPFGTVANNIVINSGTDIETWHAASNEVIFGNTTIGGLIGITLGAGDSPGGITNSNSIVQSNIMIGASAVGMQEHGTTAVSNVFTNNLTFGNATNVQLLNGHTDPHLVATDPLFINNTGTVTGNYSLQTASPARGTGLALAGISADYLGNPRPSSGATDIGAILYTTVPKVLTKITILPPSTGFFIVSPTNTGSAQLSVLCIYSDASTDNCSSVGGVTWFSDNSSMMTINSTGLATGTGSPVPSPFGPIYVNIIAYNGTVFGRTQLQVNSYTVNCLITRPETPDTNVVIGSTILVSAVDCSPDSGASSPPINGPGVGDFVAYTTSDPTKAIVNPQGEVTAVGAGSATITLHLPGITATRNITITNPTITNTTYYVREDGGTVKDANVPGGQCDGTLNVALAGSSGGHCAVNNPMYCFTDETSSTVYTGIVKGGDTCMVTPRAGGAQYNIVLKSPGVGWIGVNSITMAIPSGTPANPTKLLGSNYASCSTDAHALGNRVAMNSLGQSFVQGYNYSTQNIDIECVDFDSGVDCNSGLHTNSLTFACPSGAQQEPAITVDQFTSNFQMKNVRIHGYYTSMDGTPGPGTRWINVTAEFNTLDGTNFDNPYGYTGNRGDGFYADGAQFNFNGFSEDRAKPLSGGSVSRDGSGNLNVTFPSGSIVNYVVGTNLVLAGMTPSDLNGTFPVSAITFNQRTVNITGGNIVSYNDGYVSVWGAEFTTSAAPTFPLGSFVNITGASPSFLNGTYEVFSVSGTGFVVAASQYVHPGWTGGTISNGGTASVAVSLVASAVGSSETASVLGTASHVTPAHRGMDQQDTGFANGDGWGSGNAAMNDYLFTNCQFHRNTQDGLDGLHSNIHTSTFTFCVSEGNEGAPVKAGNADFVFHTNSLMDSNAGANMAFDPNLPPEYNQYLSTFFRANDGYGINNGAWSTFIASNNTFEVGQNVFIDDRCNSPSGCRVLPFAHFYFQNNNVLGYNDLNNPIYDGSPPALYFAEDGGVPDWQWFNNISFNTRNPPSGGSGNFWNTDPLVVRLIPDIANLAQEVNALFGNYNINLTTGSSAIQGGVANLYVPTTDFNHTATTFPNPVVGALNLAGSTPTLVSVAVTPNPGSVNVASTLAMTCIAAFSDGSHSICSSPAWTDTSGHSSVNITTGVVTGISSGADTIRATVGTIFGTATVNVIAPSTYRTHSLGRTKSLGTTKSN